MTSIVLRGKPSKWINECKKAWNAYVAAQAGVGGQIVHSTHGNTSDKTISRLPLSERCLRSPSVSTFAFLLLAHRWLELGSENGGLQDGPKVGLRMLVDKLLDLFKASAKPVAIPVELVSSWAVRWPGPRDWNTTVIDLTLGPDLLLDVSVIRERATAKQKCKVCATWWKPLARCHQPKPLMIPLPDFLHSVWSTNGSSQVLATQVVFHLAQAVELGIIQRLRAKAPKLQNLFRNLCDVEFRQLWRRRRHGDLTRLRVGVCGDDGRAICLQHEFRQSVG